MTARYEVQRSETLGRYLVAAKDLRPGESFLSEQPFVLGPNLDTSLLCLSCHRPLVTRFLVCKGCAVAPVCSDDGCPEHLTKWHSKLECDFFRTLKLTKGLNPITMVQNVGSISVLRAMLKRKADPQAWEQFMQLETHLDERRGTAVWEECENIGKFIESLGLLEGVTDSELVQKVCAAIDVNSFEVRGPALGAGGGAEALRGIYLNAALMNHDCVRNTHVSIDDNNQLVCRASTDIKKGDMIYNNYTDPLKGTSIRQQHLQLGKYFTCCCARCRDPSELGSHLSAALCPRCKTGRATQAQDGWTCDTCQETLDSDIIGYKVQCCADKLDVINKKDEKELEEYIRNVSLVLAPNHYLLLEAKQRLAGVLRDTINREPRPTKRVMRRKVELCKEILPVLEMLSPGICRIKAITLYELHATTVRLAKRMFDGREITGPEFMDELLNAEKYLKRSLEMLFIEPGNSPEGELCARALEEYRGLKGAMASVMDGFHAEGKAYLREINEESLPEEEENVLK